MTTPATRPSSRYVDGLWHRLHPATPVLRGGIWLLAIVLWLAANLRERVLAWLFDLREVGGDPLDQLGEHHLIGFAVLAVLGVVAVAVGLFWLSWRASTFMIDREAVTVRTGLLLRTSRTAKLDRIQGVTISRPLLARLVGAARIDLEVAGQNANVRLEYLAGSAAEDLRRDVLHLASGEHDVARDDDARADGARPAGTTPEGRADRPAESRILAEDGPRIVHVTPGRAVGSVLLSGTTAVTVLVVGVVVLGNLLLDDRAPIAPVGPVAAVSVFPFLIGAVTVAVRRIGRNLRYSVVATPDGVRVASGVLSTRTEAVPPGRVHALHVEQPLLWRAAGWWRVSVNRAGHESGRQQAGDGSLAPVATLAEVLALVPQLIPDLAGQEALLRAGLSGAEGADGFVGAPRRARWLRPFAWRRTGFRMTGASLLTRSGFATRELTVVPQARMQSVAVVQGLLERALDVASVHPHVVAGPVRTTLRLVDRSRAEQLFGELALAGADARARDVSHRWADRGRIGDQEARPDRDARHDQEARHDKEAPP